MQGSRNLRVAFGLCLVGLSFGAVTTRTVVRADTVTAAAQSVCIGHRPQPGISYYGSCTGHDEPEIDPLSDQPGSAQDLTWTVQLPRNGPAPVDSVGPTFWIGGVVADPKSLLEQAFLELQFYPNSVVSACTSDGNFVYSYSANSYTACAPVWKVTPNNNEIAAYNGMLRDGNTGQPLVMHAGDTITDHQFITPAHDGMHITVTDVSTGHSGTLVLNSSTDGPLMPAYSVQKVGNDLGWGDVYDAPNSLVWEIGHTGNFTNPPGQYCVPGSSTKPPCYSYNIQTWLSFYPIQIQGVTFPESGTQSHQWALVSDLGGKAEVNQDCGAANYGKPFCVYPWYAYNDSLKAFTYGGNYPGTSENFGQADQFAQVPNCSGPYGVNTTYCATVVSP